MNGLVPGDKSEFKTRLEEPILRRHWRLTVKWAYGEQPTEQNSSMFGGSEY